MRQVVQMIELSKSFGRQEAVHQVNLEIPEGTIYGIVGANGAGKSTLLRLMLGIIWPTSGEIRLFGDALPRESAAMRQRVQYVGPDGALYRSFRVRDLVEYCRLLYTRFDNSRCNSLLEALQLPLNQSVRRLSMGMQMQLRLAMALSSRPDLLLLDEPTTGLDPVVRKQFLQLIVDEAARDGTTVVMATHQLDVLERIADGIAIMYRGRLIAKGMIEEFKATIRSYQAVLPNGLPDFLQRDGRVLRLDRHGSVWTVVVEDASGEVLEGLQAIGSHVESLNLNLEDLFAHLLLKEGYSRDAILLA